MDWCKFSRSEWRKKASKTWICEPEKIITTVGITGMRIFRLKVGQLKRWALESKSYSRPERLTNFMGVVVFCSLFDGWRTRFLFSMQAVFPLHLPFLQVFSPKSAQSLPKLSQKVAFLSLTEKYLIRVKRWKRISCVKLKLTMPQCYLPPRSKDLLYHSLCFTRRKWSRAREASLSRSSINETIPTTNWALQGKLKGMGKSNLGWMAKKDRNELILWVMNKKRLRSKCTHPVSRFCVRLGRDSASS